MAAQLRAAPALCDPTKKARRQLHRCSAGEKRLEQSQPVHGETLVVVLKPPEERETAFTNFVSEEFALQQ
jgi:hypothetical protein